MKWLRSLRARRHVDTELTDEMEQHLEEKIEALVESGLSPDEARARASREFGNTTRVVEMSRDAWGFIWLDELAQDLRYGLRMLKKSPVLTATAVLSLAIGIGANTSIFNLVDGIILRMLPVDRPEELVLVRALSRQGTRDYFAHAHYEWLSRHNGIFTDLAASSIGKFQVETDGRKERITGELVSGNYFPMLRVEPVLGRAITSDDDVAGGQPVAVISYGYWQRAFGASPAAVGLSLRIGGRAFDIVGVAPKNFAGEYVGESPDFWVPLAAQPLLFGGTSYLNTGNVSWLQAVGRLRPGVTIEQAAANAKVLLDNMRASLRIDPKNSYLGGIGIEPGAGGFSALRDRYAKPLWILMALVGLVLAIACVNVANLLLARSASRRREFAVRAAIGGTRSRLLRQLLTESCLLAAIAGFLGIAVAEGMTRGLLAISHVDSLQVNLNLKVLVFAAAVCFASALAFGVAPALHGHRVQPWSILKLDGRSLSGTGRLSPLRLLVTVQAAISILVLIASGLLVRTFVNLRTLDPGFDDQQVIQASLDLSDTDTTRATLGRAFVERLSGVAGVQSVSYSGFGFGEGATRICCIDMEGYTPIENEDKGVRVQPVGPGYFATLGIPVVRGRDFTESDQKEPKVVIINEAMARHYFKDQNPIGKRFAWWHTDPKDIEIIGVVKDAKYDNLRQQTPRMVYQSVLQGHGRPNYVQVRTSSNVTRTLAAIMQDCRAAIHTVEPRARIRTFDPLSAAVDRTLRAEGLLAQLSAWFGIVALLLTSIGLYGVLAYSVARRTGEFGVRMALGANRSEILRMVVKDGVALVSAGLVVGLLAAWSFSTLLASLLYAIQPHDPLTYCLAAFALLAVAIAASYGPARRATRVEPTAALRYE